MIDIKKKLKEIFGKKEYILKLTPEVWDRLPKLAQRQIAELLAENQELKQEIAKLKEKLKKEKPQEVKVLEKAYVQRKQLEEEKRRRRVVWVPFFETPDKTLKPLNVVYVPYGGGEIFGQRGKYKYLAGFEQEEYENGLGSEVHILLKTHPKSTKFARIKPDPSITIADIFDQPYFVKTLLSGVFNSPVDVKGKTVGTIIQNPSMSAETNKIIESLKQRIAELESEIETLESEKYSVEKKYQELLVENRKLKSELSLASYRADLNQALIVSQADKIKDLMRDMATIHTSALEGLMNQVIVERINWILSDALKNARSQLEEAYGKPIDEVVWEKVENRFKTMLSDILNVVRAQEVKALEAEKKEETKK